MSLERERLARVALSQLSEPGDLRISGLTADLGGERLFDLLREERDPNGVRTDLAGRLSVLRPERDLELADKRGIRFVIPDDEEWPRQVDDLDAAEPVERVGRRPLGLWVRGPRRLDEIPRAVAIVGSRSSTTYGNEVASEIAASLARAGHCVVSGAAFGIDQAAHRGALAGGGTVGMPPSPTFWSPSFGMVTDRFGISWMIMACQPQK